MNPTTHRILGVFFLLVSICIGYDIFDTTIKIEDYPDNFYGEEISQNVVPKVYYVNPIKIILLGSVELNEGHTLTYPSASRFFILVRFLLFFMFFWHSISQFRNRNINAFTRMLAVLPLIMTLPAFIYVMNNIILDQKENILERPLWLISIALNIGGFLIALFMLKPQESPSTENQNTPKASIGIRFLHNIIDRSFLLLYCFLPIIMVLSLTVGVTSRMGDPTSEKLELLQDLIPILLGLIIVISVGFFEGVSHWSPAKFLTGYKVESTSDRPMNFGRGMLRSLCRIIPFDTWSFLFRNNWHDRFSNTTLTYSSELPWFTQQARWMHQFAKVFLFICCIGFLGIVLDILIEERLIDFLQRIDFEDSFNLFWQLALFATFLFMLIQAGFMAALLNYVDRFWDNDSEDSPRALLIALFSWFPIFGWLVSSRPTSDIEDAIGDKNFAHPEFNTFTSKGQAVRNSMRFYHITWILAVLALIKSGWNIITLFSIAALFLLCFVFVSRAWYRYTKFLTESQDLATFDTEIKIEEG